jgi:acetylornithine aminotransferase/acetylornithine/N-succinyldiaminopimelate aminotransferase
VRPLPPEYLRGIRDLCDRHGLLLILDEVQVGLGRTGRFLCHEHFGIVPDIVTLAKALGNGLPIGAMLAGEKVADTFAPGDHASTFGANPVACAAANQVMAALLEDGFLARVENMGAHLGERLAAIAERFPQTVSEARGLGLIQGLALTRRAAERGGEMVARMLERGLIANFAGNVALRFLPPLTVTRSEIDEACAIVEKTVADFS